MRSPPAGLSFLLPLPSSATLTFDHQTSLENQDAQGASKLVSSCHRHGLGRVSGNANFGNDDAGPGETGAASAAYLESNQARRCAFEVECLSCESSRRLVGPRTRQLGEKPEWQQGRRFRGGHRFGCYLCSGPGAHMEDTLKRCLTDMWDRG